MDRCDNCEDLDKKKMTKETSKGQDSEWKQEMQSEKIVLKFFSQVLISENALESLKKQNWYSGSNMKDCVHNHPYFEDYQLLLESVVTLWILWGI